MRLLALPPGIDRRKVRKARWVAPALVMLKIFAVASGEVKCSHYEIAVMLSAYLDSGYSGFCGVTILDALRIAGMPFGAFSETMDALKKEGAENAVRMMEVSEDDLEQASMMVAEKRCFCIEDLATLVRFVVMPLHSHLFPSELDDMIPEDEWYPDWPHAAKAVDVSDEVVMDLPETHEKLVRRVVNGRTRYIIVRDSELVLKANDILSGAADATSLMPATGELNYTTNRLARMWMIEDRFTSGMKAKEIAEDMKIPRHIVYSDMAELKKIEAQK